MGSKKERDPVAQTVDRAQGTPTEVAPHLHHSTALICTHICRVRSCVHTCMYTHMQREVRCTHMNVRTYREIMCAYMHVHTYAERSYVHTCMYARMQRVIMYTHMHVHICAEGDHVYTHACMHICRERSSRPLSSWTAAKSSLTTLGSWKALLTQLPLKPLCFNLVSHEDMVRGLSHMSLPPRVTLGHILQPKQRVIPVSAAGI